MSGVPPIPAIVPAAGESRRMGRAKLLLDFGGVPLIGRVVTALREGGAGPVIVVAPPNEAPEGPAVAEAARAAGARVVVPSARPSAMRASVELGLQVLGLDNPPPAVLLTPGDSPALTSDVVARVLAAWGEDPDRIIVACSRGRHAHPLVLPWDLARQIPGLPSDRGVNVLVETHADRRRKVEIPGPGLDADLNTPDDMARWGGGGPARFTLRLFAIARQRADKPEVEVALTLPATVGQLRRAIAEQHPALVDLAPKVLIAIDSDYATDDSLIPVGAKLALIPPVSGGQGPYR